MVTDGEKSATSGSGGIGRKQVCLVYSVYLVCSVNQRDQIDETDNRVTSKP
jgi:hypothetical protein